MSSHLLLDNAFEFKAKRIDIDKSCDFDKIRGYWRKNESAIIMDKRFPKPGTKKEDVETGEDLKG